MGIFLRSPKCQNRINLSFVPSSLCAFFTRRYPGNESVTEEEVRKTLTYIASAVTKSKFTLKFSN